MYYKSILLGPADLGRIKGALIETQNRLNREGYPRDAVAIAETLMRVTAQGKELHSATATESV